MKLSAVFRKVPRVTIAFVEKLPGANTQPQHWKSREKTSRRQLLLCEANRTLAEKFKL